MEKIVRKNPKISAKPFKYYQALLPVLLGLFVLGWLFLDEFDASIFSTLNFTGFSVLFILLAFCLMLLRDFGMMLRFKLLTNNDLSWRQAFHVNVLSEFTSAVTPVAVGGSSLIVVFLFKEGIDAGRSTSIMFLNLFLDELYFILFCPIVFLFIPLNEIFNSSSVIVSSFIYIFTVLYFSRIIWTTILFLSIFKRPDWIKKMFLVLFKLPYFNRWYTQVELLTDNLVETSHNFGSRSFFFWIKAFGFTFISWTARFLIVNSIFMAFVPIGDQLLVFGRQLVLWVVMAVSPTPGGSGVSEYAFKEYYSDFFSSNSTIIFITLIWRVISYYLYLLLGIIVIPSWIKNHF